METVVVNGVTLVIFRETSTYRHTYAVILPNQKTKQWTIYDSYIQLYMVMQYEDTASIDANSPMVRRLGFSRPSISVVIHETQDVLATQALWETGINLFHEMVNAQEKLNQEYKS